LPAYHLKPKFTSAAVTSRRLMWIIKLYSCTLKFYKIVLHQIWGEFFSGCPAMGDHPLLLELTGYTVV